MVAASGKRNANGAAAQGAVAIQDDAVARARRSDGQRTRGRGDAALRQQPAGEQSLGQRDWRGKSSGNP
jgi:hypothetical protein